MLGAKKLMSGAPRYYGLKGKDVFIMHPPTIRRKISTLLQYLYLAKTLYQNHDYKGLGLQNNVEMDVEI